MVAVIQGSKSDPKTRSKDTFFWAKCTKRSMYLGREKQLFAKTTCDYANDRYSQAYGEIVFSFR